MSRQKNQIFLKKCKPIEKKKPPIKSIKHCNELQKQYSHQRKKEKNSRGCEIARSAREVKPLTEPEIEKAQRLG